MVQTTLKIEGMTCGNCVKHVRKALDDLPGVEVQEVEIGKAVVSWDPASADLPSIEAALSEEGYPARRVEAT